MCAKSEHDRKIDSCLSMALGALDNSVKGAAKWEVENDLFCAVLDLVKYDRPMAESVRRAYLTKTPEEALTFVREIKRERSAMEIEAIRKRRRAST